MRLDQYVAERLGCTRTRAANIVKTGGVTVNGKSARKAGQEVSERDSIEISDTVKFSSLGGVKLDN
ncbi:MAG: TlyA family rRNA (cytidine-2'-O)-methyltransferase, partial [Clostridia bacterium]|nr:TlyA family rRNA (cytidine-2'-O)-methyltransferase [Clostridia bacterium]